MKLSASFVKRLRLEESLVEESGRAQDRLPSRTAERALVDHVERYAARIGSRAQAGYEPARETVVWMPKAYLRYRPLSAMPIADRVMYRGFAGDLSRNVADLDAYNDNRDRFESDILNDDRQFTHFGLADVTSFYRYVPHEVLVQRVIETTARADLAESLKQFLRAVMRAEVGVPQNVGPSDQFADLVIAPIERRLVRLGHAVSRYNDDFRIGGRSNRAVRNGLEALQNELHAIGLTLNDSKTTILRRETFAAHVEQMAGAEYEDLEELGDEPATNALLTGTKRMLRDALTGQDAGKGSRLQDLHNIDAVRRATRRLTRWRDPYALPRGQAIINRHPSLTQHYARYTARLVEAGYGAEVAAYLEHVFPRLILTPWQTLWLLEPIIAGASPLGTRLKRWLQRGLEPEAPPLIRARAALAAARADLLQAGDALSLIDVLPEAARPDAIAAFAVASDGGEAARRKLAGLPDSLLAKWIFDGAIA